MMSLPTMGKHGVNIGTKWYHYTYFIVGITQGLPPELSWRWDRFSECSTSSESSGSPGPRMLWTTPNLQSFPWNMSSIQTSQTSFLWGFGTLNSRQISTSNLPHLNHFCGSLMAHKLGRPYSFSQKKALFQAQKGQTRQAAAALGRGAPDQKKKASSRSCCWTVGVSYKKRPRRYKALWWTQLVTSVGVIYIYIYQLSIGIPDSM